MSGDTFPVVVNEVLPAVLDGKPVFPFRSWASANAFKYPTAATDFLSRCGSAAEAFFARAFVQRDDVIVDVDGARCGDIGLKLQVRCGQYLIDAVANRARVSLAIEIDGIGFHQRAKEQVAADYLRERRIVLLGHTVIRFTAQEVFADSAECWRQVEAIMRRRSG